MGLLEFQKLPVNTLVGADWKTFRAITRNHTVDPAYRTKYRLTREICRLLNLPVSVNERKYRKLLAGRPIENAPVFILGHWRSGTTFVHNVLACDRQFGYTTTYQTVFPHLMLWGQPLFKAGMSRLMPDKRPTDNMPLGPDLPQEEEFALSNMMPYTFYNFWFFPNELPLYRKRYLTFETATEEEKQCFRDTLTKLIRISLWNTGGKRFLSKNPPHTARVSELLKIFPDAKFIYLMRNPYTVFESTRSFFNNTIRPLQLQHISPATIEKHILETYSEIYRKYESDKPFIPQGNLIEIRFEDFESDPLSVTRKIYDTLSLPCFAEARENISRYLLSRKDYRKNTYDYTPRTLELVNRYWGEAVEKLKAIG